MHLLVKLGLAFLALGVLNVFFIATGVPNVLHPYEWGASAARATITAVGVLGDWTAEACGAVTRAWSRVLEKLGPAVRTTGDQAWVMITVLPVAMVEYASHVVHTIRGLEPSKLVSPWFVLLLGVLVVATLIGAAILRTLGLDGVVLDMLLDILRIAAVRPAVTLPADDDAATTEVVPKTTTRRLPKRGPE